MRALVVALTLLLVPALVPSHARPPGRGPSDPAPAEVQVAPVLPPARSPLDRDVVARLLDGGAEHVDLNAGTISSVVYGLKVDRRFLGLLDAAGRERLWRLLEADPAWRVTEEHGRRVALRRVPEGSEWTVPRQGVHLVDGRGFRLAFRDGPWPAGTPWASSRNLVRDAAGEGRLSLPAWVVAGAPWYGARASGVLIDVDGLGLDVLEVAPEGARALTADGLRLAAKAVDDVVDGRDRTERFAGEPGLSLTSPRPGQLEVRGRVPTPGLGWTWVRLVGPHGVWAEVEVGAGTRERLGTGPGAWYLQAVFPVPAGPAFEATAEVWTMVDGGQPTRGLTQTVTVPAREPVPASGP